MLAPCMTGRDWRRKVLTAAQYSRENRNRAYTPAGAICSAGNIRDTLAV